MSSIASLLELDEKSKAPTDLAVLASLASPPQLSLDAITVWPENRSIFGSGSTPDTPSATSAGPPARMRRGLLPLVPGPPMEKPTVNKPSPLASEVRIERLMMRPKSAVFEVVSAALVLLVVPAELFAT